MTFIGGGNGVPVTALFFPADHEPKLDHDYQYDLDNADGQSALARMVSFMERLAGAEAAPTVLEAGRCG